MRAFTPPSDGITRVRFSPAARETLLLASSWDSCLRLYDANSGSLLATHRQPRAILDCTFNANMSCALSAGLGRSLVAWDLQTLKEMQVGQHDNAIRCVEFHAATQQVFTGSWDRTVCAWDMRQGSRNPTTTLRLGAKAFCMDVGRQHRIVLGGSDRCIHIFDARQTQLPVQRHESSLKNQLRALKIGVDQRTFAAASVEARVAIEYFDPQENDESRYAFKCHRVKRDDGSEVIYPVNAIAFNQLYGTFASGGSDGSVCVWDTQAKKRVWRLDPFNTAVSSLDFSADGSRLAIGVSYMYDEGVKEPVPPPELLVRTMEAAEVAPKARA